MDTNEIGAFGYAIAMIVYACLTILLLSGWQRSAPIDSRSDVAYLCIAIAGVFRFDLVLYGLFMAGGFYRT